MIENDAKFTSLSFLIFPISFESSLIHLNLTYFLVFLYAFLNSHSLIPTECTDYVHIIKRRGKSLYTTNFKLIIDFTPLKYLNHFRIKYLNINFYWLFLKWIFYLKKKYLILDHFRLIRY